MSSSTIVPAHYIGRLYASISSMNHAHYALRLVRFFYILWRDSWVIFLFMKNSLHWYPSTCIKNDYKIGLLEERWADVWFALQWSLFFSCIASYRVQLIVRPDVTFIQECVCACDYRKWEWLISLCQQLSPSRSFFEIICEIFDQITCLKINLVRR